MDTRSSILSVVAILVVVAGACFPVFAGSGRIYRGSFDLPIPKPDSNDPYISKGWMDDAVIEIPDSFIISDIDVGISLTHTSVFDLQIFLQSPAGTRICLNMYDFRKEFFKGQDYTNTIFDDEAPVPIEEADAPFIGRFRPRSPFRLSAFNGQDTFGQWRLQIYDAHYYDTGTLDSFELMVTVPEPATAIFLILGAGLMTRLKSRRAW